MRRLKSSTPDLTASMERFNFPLTCFAAISDRLIALTSATMSCGSIATAARFDSRSGKQIATYKCGRIQEKAHSIAPLQKVLHFFVSHWFRPMDRPRQFSLLGFQISVCRSAQTQCEPNPPPGSRDADGDRLAVFSAALISSGSRFFASATLTFMALLSHFAMANLNR